MKVVIINYQKLKEQLLMSNNISEEYMDIITVHICSKELPEKIDINN